MNPISKEDIGHLKEAINSLLAELDKLEAGKPDNDELHQVSIFIASELEFHFLNEGDI